MSESALWPALARRTHSPPPSRQSSGRELALLLLGLLHLLLHLCWTLKKKVSLISFVSGCMCT